MSSVWCFTFGSVRGRHLDLRGERGARLFGLLAEADGVIAQIRSTSWEPRVKDARSALGHLRALR
jgi:hypothetical protein